MPSDPHEIRSFATRTQYASPDLIAAFAYEGVSPITDPQWRATGASSAAEYAYWAPRSCGPTCLQMALDHFGLPVPSQMEILRGCVEYGAFLPRPDGGVVGLVYEGFVRYVEARHNLVAESRPGLTLETVREELRVGNLVMASVDKEIRALGRALPRPGGHLVLVVAEDERGIHFSNPSGHTQHSREACLDAMTFESFFAGRGVVLRARPGGRR